MDVSLKATAVAGSFSAKLSKDHPRSDVDR